MTARAALALLATAFIGTCATILTAKGEHGWRSPDRCGVRSDGREPETIEPAVR